MIKIENLKKFYGATQIIDDVSLNVEKGEIFAIVGHSGAGKSTLLRCINGLEDYQSGSLKVFDKEISALKDRELRELRRDVGMIFQHFALMARKTAFENVATPLKFWGYKSDETEKRVRELLNLVGLESKAKSYPSELSGGMKKRAALARAVVLSPRVLFLDEPNSGLDPVSSRQMDALIKELRDSIGVTVVMVTHDADSIFDILDRFLIIDNKKIAFEGDIKELEHLENNPLEELFKMRKK